MALKKQVLNCTLRVAIQLDRKIPCKDYKKICFLEQVGKKMDSKDCLEMEHKKDIEKMDQKEEIFQSYYTQLVRLLWVYKGLLYEGRLKKQ